jgi:hypothetical protein
MQDRNSSIILPIYCTAHFIVDACCAAAVFVAVSRQDFSTNRLAALFLLYHALAFGLQSPFGLVIDSLDKPRLAASLGCMMCACAFLLTFTPMGTVIIVGIGNALFHVGGGCISLRTMPHRATGSGLFVAPGSLGLLLGSILGKQGIMICFPLIPIASFLSLIIACTSVPQETRLLNVQKFSAKSELVIAMLLLPIFVRSMLGFIAHFPWETSPGSLLGLTAAVVMGKALGGILADRWGWIRGLFYALAAVPSMCIDESTCGDTGPFLPQLYDADHSCSDCGSSSRPLGLRFWLDVFGGSLGNVSSRAETTTRQSAGCFISNLTFRRDSLSRVAAFITSYLDQNMQV